MGRDISSTQTISRPAKGSAGKEGPYEAKTVVSERKCQKERKKVFLPVPNEGAGRDNEVV